MLLEPGQTRLLTEKCDVFRDDFLRVETGFWLPVTDCITPPHPDLAGTPPPSSGWQYTAVRKADTSKNKREKGRGNALNTDRTTRFDFKKTEQLLKQREGNRTHPPTHTLTHTHTHTDTHHTHRHKTLLTDLRAHKERAKQKATKQPTDL